MLLLINQRPFRYSALVIYRLFYFATLFIGIYVWNIYLLMLRVIITVSCRWPALILYVFCLMSDDKSAATPVAEQDISSNQC